MNSSDRNLGPRNCMLMGPPPASNDRCWTIFKKYDVSWKQVWWVQVGAALHSSSTLNTS